MNILYCCLGDFRAPPGARQMLLGARALAERGHHCLLLVEGDPDTIRLVRGGRGEVTLDRFEFRGPWLARRTRALARDFRPDLVHVYEPRTAPLRAGLTLASEADVPLCIRFADDDETLFREAGGHGWRRGLGRPALMVAGAMFPRLWPYKHPLWYRLMLRRAAAFDAIAPELAREITRRYAVACTSILPAVPPFEAPFRAQGESGVRERLGLPTEARLLVFTGSVFRPHFDDFALLLRAFGIVADQEHDIHLVHTGRIAERYRPEELRALARDGSERVHLLGFLEDPDDVDRLLLEAAVLVQPGAPTDFNRLRLPAKVHDYLLTGRPVVTFAAGFGELLDDGREAVLTRSARPEELAGAVQSLLADQARAAEIGRRGQTRAETLFEPRQVAKEFEGYYIQALTG